MITIRPMTTRDLDAVVRIHVERFPEARSSALGKPFVRKMYRWFIANYPDLSFVASEGGRVMGIAAGSIGGYGRRTFRSAVPQIALGIIRRPNLLVKRGTFQLWRSYLRAFLPFKRARTTGGGQVMAALASIASSREGPPGVGSALLEEFEAAAWRRGATVASLSVVPSNRGARALYERHGWTLDHENATGAQYSKQNPALAKQEFAIPATWASDPSVPIAERARTATTANEG